MKTLVSRVDTTKKGVKYLYLKVLEGEAPVVGEILLCDRSSEVLGVEKPKEEGNNGSPE